MIKFISFFGVLMWLSASTAAQDNQPEPTGMWEYRDRSDDITDQHGGAAQLENSQGARLVFACILEEDASRPLTIQIQAPNFYGSSRQTDITLRFDNNPPQQSLWSTTNHTVFTATQSEVISNLVLLAPANRLIVRLRDFRQQATDLSFEVRGAGSIIDRVLIACGRQPLNAPATK